MTNCMYHVVNGNKLFVKQSPPNWLGAILASNQIQMSHNIDTQEPLLQFLSQLEEGICTSHLLSIVCSSALVRHFSSITPPTAGRCLVLMISLLLVQSLIIIAA